eukprot:TRINITY_DN27633_c0_g1_i2.p1 TRINITY_DN27633_c0_g1~~TRINITY_DN27633_c0_g1_i2.p1  ORF type:complete len:301 (+),score=65.09 TRINITY_DN27633_c0_g1_i2:51-905(+)
MMQSRSSSLPQLESMQRPLAGTANFGSQSLSGRGATKSSSSAGLAVTVTGVVARTASEGSLFSPPLAQRIESTWAIGGRKARMQEKRPHAHRLQQYYGAPFDTAYEQIAKERNLRLLESLFYEADEDGSGTMDLDEFTKSLNNDNIKAAFSRLGIQPHQSELVFKTLGMQKQGPRAHDGEAWRKGELSIEEFMTGLHDIVGDLDFSMQANELDADLLRPGNRKRRGLGKEPPKKEIQKSNESGMLPQVEARGAAVTTQLNRAFVHSALAQALYPATARKKKDNA